ncbi:hypothetical protein EVAR_815_1 [Eumeta japonica]|uniref:Uncharacterized protein n=1 Tax=Eumeta variegata TaxID=151549 RepID=A0A4C1SF45_EUMVA|nr:hypothetical protein EVAR_815_1 [Eumeta japonica]
MGSAVGLKCGMGHPIPHFSPTDVSSSLSLFLSLFKRMAALHHSWTSATSGLRGLFLITYRQNFLRGLFLITCRQNFFVCEAPSGARPSAVADVADA